LFVDVSVRGIDRRVTPFTSS